MLSSATAAMPTSKIQISSLIKCSIVNGLWHCVGSDLYLEQTIVQAGWDIMSDENYNDFNFVDGMMQIVVP